MIIDGNLDSNVLGHYIKIIDRAIKTIQELF